MEKKADFMLGEILSNYFNIKYFVSENFELKRYTKVIDVDDNDNFNFSGLQRGDNKVPAKFRQAEQFAANNNLDRFDLEYDFWFFLSGFWDFDPWRHCAASSIDCVSIPAPFYVGSSIQRVGRCLDGVARIVQDFRQNSLDLGET